MPATVVSVHRKRMLRPERNRRPEKGRPVGSALHLFSLVRSLLLVLRRLRTGGQRARAESKARARASWQARQAMDTRAHHPPAFRGTPVLVADDTGQARCVGCELCAEVCPAACIAVEPGHAEGADGAMREVAEHFAIDLGRCILCGRCEAVCPERALVMSPVVEIAARSREALVYDAKALLVPEAAVRARLDFLDLTRGAAGAAEPEASAPTP